MPRIKIFGGLREALSRGAEIAVGVFISAGHTLSDAAVYAASRFEGLNPVDLSQLVNIGSQGASAAAYLNTVDPQSELPLDAIPIQPLMYGGQSVGTRIKLIGSFLDQLGNPALDFRQDFAVPDVIAEMMRFTSSEYEKYKDDPKYKEYVAYLQEREIDLRQFAFTFAQRQF